MDSLKIENLSFAYKTGEAVLKNIQLKINEGERVAVIGATGAGKTTLLLNLCGILKGSGKIFIRGEELTGQRQKLAQKIGLVMQNPEDQLFCPSVFEELAFGLRRQKKRESEIKAIVERIENEFGISELAHRSPFQLSFGQKKKVVLAAVLINEPEILAFDEPFAGLDYSSVCRLIKIISGIKKTELIVSQDILFTASFCDRLVFLKKGEIVADIKSTEIIADRKVLQEFGTDFDNYFQMIKGFWKL